MDLETVMLSEVSQRQVPYGISHMRNLKYDTGGLL